MLLEREVKIAHASLYRWVQRSASEMEKPLRQYWKNAYSGDSWCIDETYVRVSGQWAYLYRVVDKYGHTIDFTFHLDAKRFLGKALNQLKTWQTPHTINTDKAATFNIAIAQLKFQGKCPAIQH